MTPTRLGSEGGKTLPLKISGEQKKVMKRRKAAI
jgi:hypothetical protein